MVEIKYPEQFTKSGNMEAVNDDEINIMIKECLDEVNESTPDWEVSTGDTVVQVIRDDEYYKIEVIKKKVYFYASVDVEK